MQLRSPLRETIPSPNRSAIVLREFHLPAFRFPWHLHAEMELTWILAGSGLRYVGGSIEAFHVGDFCLLGGNLPHAWLSPAGERGPVRSLVVQFDPGRWGKELAILPEFAPLFVLFERAQRGLAFDAGLGERLRKRLRPTASPLPRFTALVDILGELTDASARPIAPQPWGGTPRRGADPRIQRILTFLSQNSSGPIPQAQAAAVVRLSPAAFSRFFRRAFGKTFQTYLADLRLGDACRRLIETDHEISRIAFDSGFENLSTFNRTFRLRHGCSPRSFRHQPLAPARRPPENPANSSEKKTNRSVFLSPKSARQPEN